MSTSPRAWQTVLERIESDLLAGRLAPGQRLAPERELAAQLGVGRSSVREALRVLEVLGLIRTGTGSGPTSGAFIVATPSGGLAALLRLQVAATSFPIADVMRTRTILEVASVQALALAEDRDTSSAREVLVAMDAEELSLEEFLVLDARLHLALAEASGNTVVAAMMEGLRNSIESYVTEGARGLADWPAVAQRLRAEHHALIEAVEAGDAERARRLVREHIEGYYAQAGGVYA